MTLGPSGHAPGHTNVTAPSLRSTVTTLDCPNAFRHRTTPCSCIKLYVFDYTTMTGSGKAAAGQSGNSSTTDATVAKSAAAAAARSCIQQETLQNLSFASLRTGNLKSQADLTEFWQLLQLRQGWLPPEKSHDYTDSKTAMQTSWATTPRHMCVIHW
jgi:hypothetical protein